MRFDCWSKEDLIRKIEQLERVISEAREKEIKQYVVDMFAKGIYQVLQDNGARMFDLKTKQEE